MIGPTNHWYMVLLVGLSQVVDHTNCLQVAIKTHSFIVFMFENEPTELKFIPSSSHVSTR